MFGNGVLNQIIDLAQSYNLNFRGMFQGKGS